MATKKKTSVEDIAVDEKLKSLFKLQSYVSEIDKIRTLRGELPLEVADLDDEIAGLGTRINKYELDLKEIADNSKSEKVKIEGSKARIEKYNKQIENVRNSKEYDHLTKELEYESLEIELAEKKIRDNSESEEKIRDKAKKTEALIEPRLLSAFKRIRKNARNGLAIVPIQRGACGGCFNKIPPQRQMDIKMGKKIIVCEYCGRIMIDPDMVGIKVDN